MNILHYALGFPPYRTGGLTKFCMDLMHEQINEGHQVSMIWPGTITSIGGKTTIKQKRSVEGCGNYEIVNPIPVPYDEGIVDVSAFVASGDINVYNRFLETLRPEIIHVHTLMGLHENLLIAAKRLGIKLVFTTHDFFPICAKVTLFRDGMVCPDAMNCNSCPKCNLTALSLRKIQVLQSPAYRVLKNNPIVKHFRKTHRDEYLSGEQQTDANPTNLVADYLQLRNHYSHLLDYMDFIHYNSSLAKGVYEQFMGVRKGAIIPITHADVRNRKQIYHYNHTTLRITYLSAQSGAKGYYVLKKVLDKIWEKGKDFELNVFFRPNEGAPYIRSHDRYGYDQLGSIFNNTDVLIQPSIWYETFGFTVLEALSYGTPVIVSDHVGAKDILPGGGGIIINSAAELEEVITSLTWDTLESMNKTIVKNFDVPTIQDCCKEIMERAYAK